MNLKFKNFSSVLLLMAGVATVHASDFDNIHGVFTWPTGNESEPSITEEASNAVLSAKVKVGTDLTVGDYDGSNNGIGHLPSYLPGTTNAGCVASDMIEYSIKLKKGLSIIVTSIEYDAIKIGTDNAFFSWSYVTDENESSPIALSDPKSQIRRNNDSNKEAPITHIEEIEADGCRTFALRFYISDVANNKQVAIGNIKINGVVSGDIEQRAFADFKIDFRTDPYVVKSPESGLPTGVTIDGTFHDGQHGYSHAKVSVPVDGPVCFTIGSCGYSDAASVCAADGSLLAQIDTKAGGCDTSTSSEHFTTWYYNSEEPETLTFDLGAYCPFFQAAACELLSMCNIRYYDTDGKTILGEETVQGNSPLAFAYGADEVTMAEGEAFRGWFNAPQSTAIKVQEGTAVTEDISLYAKASEIEIPTSTSRYIYELNKINFYDEDHEAIDFEGGSYHDAQHGWVVTNGSKINLPVAGKALITIGNCRYSADSEAMVIDAEGNIIGTFSPYIETDGTGYTVKYDGPATTISVCFTGTAYIHKVTVYNVVDFVEYDESTRFYSIPANDANSFLLALTSANATGNARIFLPNGVYDLGELCLTTISGKNISIIGESMEGTIIRNAPLVENEGIGTTATLLNTSDGLYLQDLTLQNALDYYSSGSAGRAVCLQDKGKNTICKNVKMLSYQDTYYSNNASNFYWEDSEIHGTVDYLCGDGNVVYNRVKLVNESRSRNGKSGSDVLCAPNCTATTDSRFNWGYVFLDCTIRSECNDFTFARSWGGESKAQFIRTTILDGSLASARFTTAGMNIAASAFKEYQTMDEEGNIINPESHIMNFTHNTGDKSFETILSDEEAAEFTIEKIFGEWAPDQIAAQVTTDINADLTADCYLICITGSQPEVVTTEELSDRVGNLAEGISATVRAANSRGGFGPCTTIGEDTSIEKLQTPAATSILYNMYGQHINEAHGLFIENGKVVWAK